MRRLWGYEPDAVPVDVALKSISMSYSGTCGVESVSGEVDCWAGRFTAYNWWMYPPEGSFEDVSFTGGEHGCARTAFGDVVCWGGLTMSGAAQPPEGARFFGVTTGVGFSCGIDLEQHVECWEDDDWKDWDDLSNILKHLPTVAAGVPTGGTWSSVSAQGDHACALDTDGGVTCFGFDVGETLAEHLGVDE